MKHINLIFIILFLAALVYSVHSRGERRHLEKSLSDSRRHIQAMEREAAEERAAARAREKTLRATKAANDALQNELRERYAADEINGVWSVDICPDDVYGCLLRALPGGPAGLAAGGPDTARGRSPPGRADQR